MPKLKTHKGTKKVLKVRKGGTISIGRFTNANTDGDYTLFKNAGIEVSMTYYVD